MSRKRNTNNPGGAVDRKRRGLKSVTVELTPEEHARITRAAVNSAERYVNRWCARVLLDAAAREFPEKPAE